MDNMPTPPGLATSSDFAATLSSMQAFLKRRDLEKERSQGTEQEQGCQEEESPSSIASDASLVAAEATHQDQGQDESHKEPAPSRMPIASKYRQTSSLFDVHSPNTRQEQYPHFCEASSLEEMEIVEASEQPGVDRAAGVEAKARVEDHTPGRLDGSARCDVIICKITRLLTSTDGSAFLSSAKERLGWPPNSTFDCSPQIIRRATDPESVPIALEQEMSQPLQRPSVASLSESKWARQKISSSATLGPIMQSRGDLTPPLRTSPVPMHFADSEPTILARKSTVNSNDKICYTRPFLLAFSGYKVPPSGIGRIQTAIKEGNNKIVGRPNVGITQAVSFVSRSNTLSARSDLDELQDSWPRTAGTATAQHVPAYDMSTASPSGRLSGAVFRFKQPELIDPPSGGYRDYPTTAIRSFRSRSVS
ncbi:hypothetical protein EMPS_01181 [Entomortierella parvispora]|uniref:Uncharacterized protein n=1 Tax=Entomortierella parvispora TaxID=205924 RepID=A0A9P3H2D9_9FUNG|nr:hypothetical protein EMPS_01181 [Entomortierella parvispora]